MWTGRQPPALQDPTELRYLSDLTDAEWAHIEPLIMIAGQAWRRLVGASTIREGINRM